MATAAFPCGSPFPAPFLQDSPISLMLTVRDLYYASYLSSCLLPRRLNGCTGNVLVGPATQRSQDRPEILGFGSRHIPKPGRLGLIGLLGHEAAFLQPFQSLGQDVGGNRFGRQREIAVGALAAQEHVAHDHECPLVAEKIECIGDRTHRPQQHSPPIFHPGLLPIHRSLLHSYLIPPSDLHFASYKLISQTFKSQAAKLVRKKRWSIRKDNVPG